VSTLHGHRKRLVNEEADDLRAEAIAAQLEERYQEDIRIEWLFEQDMEAGSPLATYRRGRSFRTAEGASKSSMTSHHQKQRWGASSKE
jgi:hypothetical protein